MLGFQTRGYLGQDFSPPRNCSFSTGLRYGDISLFLEKMIRQFRLLAMLVLQVWTAADSWSSFQTHAVAHWPSSRAAPSVFCNMVRWAVNFFESFICLSVFDSRQKKDIGSETEVWMETWEQKRLGVYLPHEGVADFMKFMNKFLRLVQSDYPENPNRGTQIEGSGLNWRNWSLLLNGKSFCFENEKDSVNDLVVNPLVNFAIFLEDDSRFAIDHPPSSWSGHRWVLESNR